MPKCETLRTTEAGGGSYVPFTQVYKGERRFTEKTLKVLGFGFYVSLLFYEKKESELFNDKVRSSSAFVGEGMSHEEKYSVILNQLRVLLAR